MREKCPRKRTIGAHVIHYKCKPRNNLHIICHILLFVFSAKIEEKRKREEEKRNIEEEQVYYWLFKAVKMKMRESMHLK